VLHHLIFWPGPCNFEILEYRLFLESVCVGKQELGLVLDPSSKGHLISPSSSIYTALRASFRLWVLFRLKVLIEAGVSRSFDEMITIDLVEPTLTIRLQTCTTLRLTNR
jgi:hypothetical protein